MIHNKGLGLVSSTVRLANDNIYPVLESELDYGQHSLNDESQENERPKEAAITPRRLKNKGSLWIMLQQFTLSVAGCNLKFAALSNSHLGLLQPLRSYLRSYITLLLAYPISENLRCITTGGLHAHRNMLCPCRASAYLHCKALVPTVWESHIRRQNPPHGLWPTLSLVRLDPYWPVPSKTLQVPSSRTRGTWSTCCTVR